MHLSQELVFEKSGKMVKQIFLMSFGLGITTALAVTFIFKFNPQQEILFIWNSILQVMLYG